MTTPTADATKHGVNETVAPAELKSQRSWVSFPATVLIVLVVFFVVFAWGLWLGVDWDNLLWFSGMLLICLTVFGLAALVSVWQERAQSEPYQISFDGEQVRFQRGQRWIHAPIREMKWFQGKSNHARATRELPLRRMCLILVFPTGFSVACGLTMETQNRWLSIIKDSNCPRLVNLDGFQGILLGLCQISLTVAGGFIGYAFGKWLEQAIVALNWPRPLAGAFTPSVCIAGIWLGFVMLPITVAGWRRNTTEERNRWLGASLVIPCKFGVPLLMGPPTDGSAVLISTIMVTLLIAMTYLLFCRGPNLTERGCETNLDD